MSDDATDRVWKLVKSSHTCMLTDLDDGKLRARPMAPSVDEATKTILFVTDRSSPKTEEVRNDPHVSVTISNGPSNTYVSISGTARVSDDRERLKRIWSTPMQAYFPGGPEDPKAVLLEVTPTEAQIWEGPNAVVSAIKMAAAVVTGTRPDQGTNEKVAMR